MSDENTVLNFQGDYNCNYIVTSITKAPVVLHNYLMYGR